MATVKCQVQIPPDQKLGENLTVGRNFFLLCDGEWPVLDKNRLELRLPEADKYKLQLLDFEMTSKEQAKLTVTSYKPGQHQLSSVQLAGDSAEVSLENVGFTVQSVINPQEPAEPYGPMGPFVLRLPLVFWLVIILFLLLLLALVFARMRRSWQKKKMVEDIRQRDSALSPVMEFHKNIRGLFRQEAWLVQTQLRPLPNEIQSVLDEVEKNYRLFLGRRLLVPTLQWSDSLILREIRKTHRKLYEAKGKEISALLAELRRAKSSKNLTVKDLIQLIELCRKNVEDIQGSAP